jgi:hypothetical protein
MKTKFLDILDDMTRKVFGELESCRMAYRCLLAQFI